jgi:Fe-S-cluster containining protein
MCCDGTLHNFTFLRAGEEARARQLGLRVRQRRDGIPLFLQPCAAFNAPVCVVYAQRPHACRQYKCKLLLKMEAGGATLESALETVQRACELIAALRRLMPDPDSRLSLDQQAKSNWRVAEPLPAEVQPVYNELAALLKSQYGVRWLRGRSRFRRWKKKFVQKGI